MELNIDACEKCSNLNGTLYVCGGKHINHFIASIVLKLVLENDFTLS
jgi:hypothetical protein